MLSDELKERINKLLRVDKWSPELISYRLKKEGEFCVSPERIYQWIWEMKKSNKKESAKYKDLYKTLKHGQRRRKRGNAKDRRGAIANRVSIEERPED